MKRRSERAPLVDSHCNVHQLCRLHPHVSLTEDVEKMVIMNDSNTATKIDMCCLHLRCETGLRRAAGDPDALFFVAVHKASFT
ncbi:hypothetical protein QQF64_007655 [Cirrhinus molitorella]|uniref:Uncharacterized protein n=1 Tax=Cirrhinus molitorella TaxID=172907 RepID=A0ABR3MCP7_9TELE